MNQTGRRVRRIASVINRQISDRRASPLPRIFDHATIVDKVQPCKEIVMAVESSYERQWKNEVENPQPLCIDILGRGNIGPGEGHVSAGYFEGEPTWTTKLENVHFFDQEQNKKIPKSSLFVINSATDGTPLAILQDNRYLSHLRTGAAGAVAVKHFAGQGYNHVAFIGTGSNATALALSTHHVHRFEAGYAYSLDKAHTQAFANDIHNRLGYRIMVCDTAEEAIRNSDVVFVQTPSATPVFEASWLKSHATVIASGSDHRLKNQLPVGLLKHCKYVTDRTPQCAQFGELRTALQHCLRIEDVYAELGEVVAGVKPGRAQRSVHGSLEQPEDGVVMVDLSLGAAAGAQDAAVGQYAWQVLCTLDWV